MKDKLTKKILTENFFMILHDMNIYQLCKEKNHKYILHKISSPRCAEDRACFKNAFNVHLKCIQIHLIMNWLKK